ncbi:MAG: carbohydrate ABC transporter permease [Clostridia bacterium]|nr:carbohydrate ABC transporter permease [Clostridia bacterium]
MKKVARIKSKRNINGSVGGTVFVFIILVLFGTFMILPFVYSIVQSLKPPEELFRFPPRFFVSNPTFKNFKDLFGLTNSLWVPFSRYILNSAIITLIGTVGHVILASMAAFAIAKFPFPGSKIIFNIVVWSLLFTGEVTALPQYIVTAKLGLINTYWALILPAIGGSLGFFLMKQFMEQVPNGVVEAATVDGANELRTWWSIVLPITKPAWLTLIIFSFQSLWNNSGDKFIYNEEIKTLPSILSQISASGISRVGAAAAATVILMIPPMITFLASQRSVIETMAYSGIKE